MAEAVSRTQSKVDSTGNKGNIVPNQLRSMDLMGNNREWNCSEQGGTGIGWWREGNEADTNWEQREEVKESRMKLTGTKDTTSGQCQGMKSLSLVGSG